MCLKALQHTVHICHIALQQGKEKFKNYINSICTIKHLYYVIIFHIEFMSQPLPPFCYPELRGIDC